MKDPVPTLVRVENADTGQTREMEVRFVDLFDAECPEGRLVVSSRIRFQSGEFTWGKFIPKEGACFNAWITRV